MALEAIRCELYTEKSDVYIFGILNEGPGGGLKIDKSFSKTFEISVVF